MILLGCPVQKSSQTCQFPVFQAHRNELGQQGQHLTGNTGSGHICLFHYLIYSGDKNTLKWHILAKFCYWNYTHTFQLPEYHTQKGLLQ